MWEEFFDKDNILIIRIYQPWMPTVFVILKDSLIPAVFSTHASQEKIEKRWTLNHRVLQVVDVPAGIGTSGSSFRDARLVVCCLGREHTMPTILPYRVRFHHESTHSTKGNIDLRCIARRDSVSSQGPCIKDRGTVTSNLSRRVIGLKALDSWVLSYGRYVERICENPRFFVKSHELRDA